MYIFVNELSFQAQAGNVINANRLMSDLLTVIKGLQLIQGSDPIRTSMTLWQQKLSDGYTLNDWLTTARRDEMIWFLSIVRKGPYVETMLDSELAYHECLFHNDDVSSSSLAGAAYFEGLLSSLQNSTGFQVNRIGLKYREDEGAFSDVEVINVFDPAATAVVVTQVTADMLQGINSWLYLWEKRATLFPNLLFCGCVQDQLSKLGFTPTNVKIVIRHLSQMNEFCQSLTPTNANPDCTKMGVDASKETAETLVKYGYERTFLCPDGMERLFDWHTKQLGQNIRIHFYPQFQGCHILIGYIGQHLDTVRYH